jgi:putative transposase
MKSKFSEHQIISILKQVESGRAVAEVCLDHSISTSTYLKWKAKYGRMEASDLKRCMISKKKTGSSKECLLIFH